MKTLYNLLKNSSGTGSLVNLKQLALLLAMYGTHTTLYGQASFTALDANNVRAHVSDVGIFFNNLPTQMAGYEVPQGSGKTAIYTGSNWFGGYDVNGQLKLAVAKYYGVEQDFWPGALDTTNAGYVTPNPLSGTLWTVSKADIDAHLLNYMLPGYTPALSIASWPAHGDTTLGQAYHLAPFVDMNYNGAYEPLLGDFPCIKGDRAVYTILNDMGGVHGSGGQPLGIELHYMFYQYATNDYLNDVTFVDLRMINRSTQSLSAFRTGFFLDADLGNYSDDYAGCDSARNVMYFYNADGFDENFSGQMGYGATPPAIGIMTLGQSASSIGFFTNGAAFPYGDPLDVDQYYNALDARYQDGTPWLDNMGSPARFMYPDDPNNAAGWSEYTAANPGSDRRGVISVSHDLFQPWEEVNLTYAVLFAEGSDQLNSVSELLSLVDETQQRYDNGEFEGCYQQSLSIEENAPLSLAIYPNPNNGMFHIDLSQMTEPCTVQLTDMAGRVVEQAKFAPGQIVTFVTTAQAGVYVVKVMSGRGDVTQRVVIE